MMPIRKGRRDMENYVPMQGIYHSPYPGTRISHEMRQYAHQRPFPIIGAAFAGGLAGGLLGALVIPGVYGGFGYPGGGYPPPPPPGYGGGYQGYGPQGYGGSGGYPGYYGGRPPYGSSPYPYRELE